MSTATVDVSSRDAVHTLVKTAATHGDITGLIHAAGVSPSQAPPEAILHVDLYGTAGVWLGRAHSLGHRRQTLNLLGYAVMTNSLARARGRPALKKAA